MPFMKLSLIPNCPTLINLLCSKYPGSDFFFFLTSWLGVLRGVWQERHQHEQAGGHLTGGKIPCVRHEDPAPHQGLRLRFRKGNWHGCRAMYGNNVQRLFSMLFLLHLCGTEGIGATHRFECFHSWKRLGSCLSNNFCGFLLPAKNDTEPVRQEKCGFLWGNAGKTHLNERLCTDQLAKCLQSLRNQGPWLSKYLSGSSVRSRVGTSESPTMSHEVTLEVFVYKIDFTKHTKDK